MLGTREAAELLRVSEATVRRWSDQGLLPVQRTGRRRERRFKAGDVRAFLASAGHAGQAPRTSPSDAVTVGGISIRGKGHYAVFYSTDEGRVRLAPPFLDEGLKAGQLCFLIGESPYVDAHRTALADAGLLDPALASGQLATARAPGSTVAEALAFWETGLWQAVGRGGGPIRIVAEMNSVRQAFSSEAEMLRFEAQLDVLLRRFPVVALCQYDVRELSGEAMLMALKAHPDLFSQPLGNFLL